MTFQYPNAGVVISSRLLGTSQQFLLVSIGVAWCFQLALCGRKIVQNNGNRNRNEAICSTK